MSAKLVCWQCGGSLHEVPRPIRRLTRCPHCRTDLHVCRMCVHYTTRYIGHCAHDRAERVLEKTIANFCTHFRPRPDAHLPPDNPELDKANAALGELFGIEGGAGAVIETPPAGPKRDTADSARRKLESMFGIPHEEPPEPDDANREVGEEAEDSDESGPPPKRV